MGLSTFAATLKMPIIGHGAPAPEQDLAGTLIIPVVNDVLHQVCSASRGDRLEKIHSLESRPAKQVRLPKLMLAGALENMGLVGQNALQVGMPRHDRSQQHPIAAANVHQAAPFAEVVGSGDRGRPKSGYFGHGGIKKVALIRRVSARRST
jgi:hypothetical protein